MPSLLRVETRPSEGFPDRVWDSSAEGPGDPLVDAYARAARPVDELYSEALAGVGLRALRTVLRLQVAEPRAAWPEDQVLLEVWRDQLQMPAETGFVRLGRAVGTLGADARARLALEVVHTAARLLAEARGEDPAGLDACRDHVRANAFVFTRSTPWKASSDRRHQARACYRLSHPDGFARVRLEVRRRGEADVLAASAPAVASCTLRGVLLSASTLRWSSPQDVGLVPLTGQGASRQGRLAAHLHADGRVDFDVRDDVLPRTPAVATVEDPDATLPRVVGSLT